jgi:hypothetical protein
MSDLALAAITKQRSEKSTEVVITNDNAKHAVHTTVKVIDPDPEQAYKVAAGLMDAALTEFGDPRENGSK